MLFLLASAQLVQAAMAHDRPSKADLVAALKARRAEDAVRLGEFLRSQHPSEFVVAEPKRIDRVQHVKCRAAPGGESPIATCTFKTGAGRDAVRHSATLVKADGRWAVTGEQ